MSTLLYIGAALGFVAGACGYIIVRFWYRPVRRYRRIKARIAALLETAPGKNQADAARRCAADLSDAFVDDLPHWYRMVLANRRESPEEAARILMTLAGTRNPEHIGKQADAIRRHLLLDR